MTYPAGTSVATAIRGSSVFPDRPRTRRSGGLGEAPFSSRRFDTPVKKIMAHVQAPVPPIRDQRSEVPEALDQVFQKMMAKKPEDRYQSAAAVRDDLMEMLLDEDEHKAMRELERIADYRNYRRYEIYKEVEGKPPIALSEYGTGSGGASDGVGTGICGFVEQLVGPLHIIQLVQHNPGQAYIIT